MFLRLTFRQKEVCITFSAPCRRWIKVSVQPNLNPSSITSSFITHARFLSFFKGGHLFLYPFYVCRIKSKAHLSKRTRGKRRRQRSGTHRVTETNGKVK